MFSPKLLTLVRARGSAQRRPLAPKSINTPLSSTTLANPSTLKSKTSNPKHVTTSAIPPTSSRVSPLSTGSNSHLRRKRLRSSPGVELPDSAIPSLEAPDKQVGRQDERRADWEGSANAWVENAREVREHLVEHRKQITQQHQTLRVLGFLLGGPLKRVCDSGERSGYNYVQVSPREASALARAKDLLSDAQASSWEIGEEGKADLAALGTIDPPPVPQLADRAPASDANEDIQRRRGAKRLKVTLDADPTQTSEKISWESTGETTTTESEGHRTPTGETTTESEGE